MTDQPSETRSPDPETGETLSDNAVSGPPAEEGESSLGGSTTTDETFPRSYVEKLRDESAKHRQRAADRDTLAERLHVALVAATGRLADPSDLPFDEGHLSDSDALTAAIDDLIARKPHLASRRIVGDVGQGATGADVAVDLAGMLRGNASREVSSGPEKAPRPITPLRGMRGITRRGNTSTLRHNFLPAQSLDWGILGCHPSAGATQ